MNQPETNLERLALRLAGQYQIGSARVSEMLATVDAVAASNIWNRARRAKTIYTGHSVSEMGLYFTKLNHYVVVSR